LLLPLLSWFPPPRLGYLFPLAVRAPILVSVVDFCATTHQAGLHKLRRLKERETF
jgi:hypothetical protein